MEVGQAGEPVVVIWMEKRVEEQWDQVMEAVEIPLLSFPVPEPRGGLSGSLEMVLSLPD